MNYVENNGKKVAAVLCVASCFPVVATVYAMETEPGWHGDKYIKEDATVAKGWEEIEGKSYYFSEDDGTIEKETTQKAVVASVSSNISGDVQETVANVAKEAVVKEVQKQEEEKNTQEVVETPVDNTTETQTPAEEVPAEPTTPVEEVPAEEPTTPVEPETPAEPTTPVEEPSTPETPAEPTTPVEPETPSTPEIPTTPVEPTVPETPAEPTTPTNPYADLNARIAAAAQTLVGVTDGQWCTQVVQQALALAGVSDAYQLWPDEYAGMYGYYTNDPQPGNLIYYNNGGRGVDHIAIYIGNGLAVHGNYNGRTVIESVYIPGGAPQFIQVCR
ncbi:NlpC/P60 family protein [Faecalitalea cylindroides]|uniref:C40 family peptidase n=1 Tax=Faecalitalea cylindroides TaxID=39483 RepID=UPI001898D9F2|nr:NlpC/P60 family protein [Faecalitalea cylindroides]MDB7946517.1 NlpC/P60 family protein [Faecalitalea cylindroides]MDB7948379.1 NlpC/P60 family protein [Faecalitalea cylindroides]MDB7950298.1 NlpC/P60 family protein [Faecalitalea cylindroides]